MKRGEGGQVFYFELVFEEGLMLIDFSKSLFFFCFNNLQLHSVSVCI